MSYDEVNEIANLISIREYINSVINSNTVKKNQVNPLQKLIGKIDQKIINFLLSTEFSSEFPEEE